MIKEKATWLLYGAYTYRFEVNYLSRECTEASFEFLLTSNFKSRFSQITLFGCLLSPGQNAARLENARDLKLGTESILELRYEMSERLFKLRLALFGNKPCINNEKTQE